MFTNCWENELWGMKEALACSVMKIGFVVGVLSESVMILGGLEGRRVVVHTSKYSHFIQVSSTSCLLVLSLCFVGCSESGER